MLEPKQDETLETVKCCHVSIHFTASFEQKAKCFSQKNAALRFQAFLLTSLGIHTYKNTKRLYKKLEII